MSSGPGLGLTKGLKGQHRGKERATQFTWSANNLMQAYLSKAKKSSQQNTLDNKANPRIDKISSH